MKKTRFRVTRSVIDQAERQDLKRACLAFTYEYILHPPGQDEDLRLMGTAIVNIKDGKVGFQHSSRRRSITNECMSSSQTELL